MNWTLLILILTGTYVPDMRFHSIPMMNKEACVRAAKEATDNTSYPQIGYICISSETGEIVRPKK